MYDLSWSQDSTRLISGSVDNTAIVWNISNGKREGEREREREREGERERVTIMSYHRRQGLYSEREPSLYSGCGLGS